MGAGHKIMGADNRWVSNILAVGNLVQNQNNARAFRFNVPDCRV